MAAAEAVKASSLEEATGGCLGAAEGDEGQGAISEVEAEVARVSQAIEAEVTFSGVEMPQRDNQVASASQDPMVASAARPEAAAPGGSKALGPSAAAATTSLLRKSSPARLPIW